MTTNEPEDIAAALARLGSATWASRAAGRPTAGSDRPGPAPRWPPRPTQSAARRATTWPCTWR